MSDFATPGANAFLDGTALPATLYVQGHTGNPGTNGTNNVAAETDRIAVSSWSVASGGSKSSTALAEILNAAAAETWTHVTYWSAASGGTCWFVEDLASDVPIEVGDTIQIDAGASTITVPVWA